MDGLLTRCLKKPMNERSRWMKREDKLNSKEGS